MARRVALPLPRLPFDEAERPTAEAMREQLGGPASPSGHGAELVKVRSTGRIGIALHRTEHDVDVVLGPTLVRRTRADEVDPAAPPVDPVLAPLIIACREFAALSRGAEVVVLPPASSPAAEPTPAVLVEKCRFGAIVRRADGAHLAVGFARIARPPHA